MKIYCMYGVNLPTERSYYYAKSKNSHDVFCDESNMTDARCQAQNRAQRAKEEYEEKAKEFLGSTFTDTALDEMLRPPELVIVTHTDIYIYIYNYCCGKINPNDITHLIFIGVHFYLEIYV